MKLNRRREDARPTSGRVEKGAKDIMSGWNGSDRKGAAPVQPKVTAKKPSPVRGIVAGAVVVVLAVVVYFAFFSDSENAQKIERERRPTIIKEVTPATAPTNSIEQVQTSEKPKRDLRTYIDEHGVKRYPSGARVNDFEPQIKVKLGGDTPASVFQCAAEKQIYFLVNIEPGDFMIGGRDFTSPRSRKELEEALLNKIELSDDDTPEQRKAKEDVIAVKKELKAALKRGEDPSVILQESYDECLRLAQFSRDIEGHVRDAAANGEMTEQDLEDYVNAANKMLEDRGVAPLKLNCVSKRALRIRKAKRK